MILSLVRTCYVTDLVCHTFAKVRLTFGAVCSTCLEFDSCQGNVRDFTKSQGSVGDKYCPGKVA